MTGWKSWRDRYPFGCNILSPIFSPQQSTVLNCYRMKPKVPGVRTFTIYRKVPGISTCTDMIVAHLNTRDGKGTRRNFGFYVPRCVPIPADCKRWKCHLVFEIMDDGKRHDRPWAGFPSVGSFQNFERASSIGIWFE